MLDNKNKITMGSLFSGFGGFEIAAQKHDINVLWQSEIEPWAVELLKARFPETKQLGDICDINGADIEPVDVITFGSPCFPAGTLVLTDKGFVEIENIRVGMKVLTHKGRWRKVTEVGFKYGETIKLKGNHYGLECTSNHPIYSACIETTYPTLQDGRKTTKRNISKEKDWTEAKDMKGKLWATPNTFASLDIPIPHNPTKGHKFPKVDEDLMYFIGRWLGDGWVRNEQRAGRPIGQTNGQIYLCDSKDKVDELVRIVSAISSNYNIEECKTVTKVRFVNKVLCDWLVNNFGKYAVGKSIPSWLLSQPYAYRYSVLQGIIDSDGYANKPNTYKISTVSKKLAHGIRMLAETLGCSTSLYFHTPKATKEIEGRIVNQRPYYTVTIVKSKTRGKLYDDLHSWYRVRGIEPTYETKKVYNITVEEDNSYIADSIVVHNCQNMSMAGNRKGLAGEQSSMFYEAIRIIREMRKSTNGEYPKYIVWENVNGALTSNKGADFRAVLEEITESEIPMPRSGKWANAGMVRGGECDITWRVLDAQYWGVPQRRKRIYLVGDYRNGCSAEILFKPESLLGDTAESCKAGKGTSETTEECVGETS